MFFNQAARKNAVFCFFEFLNKQTRRQHHFFFSIFFSKWENLDILKYQRRCEMSFWSWDRQKLIFLKKSDFQDQSERENQNQSDLRKIDFRRSQYQNDISHRRWYFEMAKFSYFGEKIEKKWCRLRVSLFKNFHVITKKINPLRNSPDFNISTYYFNRLFRQ